MSRFIPVEPEKWAEMVKAQAEVARLKAEVERLTKAGDAMAEVCENDWKNRIQGSLEYHLEAKPHKIPHEYFLVQDWNAAKDGKQS